MKKPRTAFDPDKLRSAASLIGRLGGSAGTGKSKSRGTEKARAAARARWGKRK